MFFLVSYFSFVFVFFMGIVLLGFCMGWVWYFEMKKILCFFG